MRSKTFRGGIHPSEFKHLTEHKIIEKACIPERVIVPLQQHIGAPTECIIEKDTHVKAGQPLSKAIKLISVPVHASISGLVKSIEFHPNPLGTKSLAVTIEHDGSDDSTFTEQDPDINNMDPDILLKKIKTAGIAGMGGASFPTHVKLTPPSDKKINTLLINGVECEPFLTADHRLMLEKSDEILKGIHILTRILRVRHTIIGIEKNKPDAIQLMQKKTKRLKKISVIPLPVKYPQGGEKQLIQAALNRQVPSGGLPMDVECVVQNVGTVFAVYEAIYFNKPLIERVVTVTGPGITEPKNILARIGTPFKDLIEFCGGYTPTASKILNGGPMMGIAQVTDDVPVVKGTSGILVLDQLSSKIPEESTCISCARCVDICPMKLMPNRIASYIEHNRIEDAEKYGLLDCIECGSCTYICPAKRHLVHYIKFGKMLYNERRVSS
ncbi:electron transport complex subunit RsxC [bacterium]|nr:electron transport complex subunit RsxC [bacterium]